MDDMENVISVEGLDVKEIQFREESCKESSLLENYLEKRIEKAETYVKMMRKDFGRGEQCQGFPLTKTEQRALHPDRPEEEL